LSNFARPGLPPRVGLGLAPSDDPQFCRVRAWVLDIEPPAQTTRYRSPELIFWLDLSSQQLPHMAFSKYQRMITPRQFFVRDMYLFEGFWNALCPVFVLMKISVLINAKMHNVNMNSVLLLTNRPKLSYTNLLKTLGHLCFHFRNDFLFLC